MSEISEAQKVLTDIGVSFASLGLPETASFDNVQITPHRETRAGGWFRGGGETYILPMRLAFEDAGASRHMDVIAKACVHMNPEIYCRDWNTRRAEFAAADIPCSTIFGYAQATYIEEFLPDTLVDYVRAHPDQAEPLLSQAAEIFGRLGALGYAPKRVLDDLRTDGRTVKIVDVGEDIGHRLERSYDLWGLFTAEMEKEGLTEYCNNVLRASFLRGAESVTPISAQPGMVDQVRAAI